MILYLWPMIQYALVYGLAYPAHIGNLRQCAGAVSTKMMKMMMIHLWDGHNCSARSG